MPEAHRERVQCHRLEQMPAPGLLAQLKWNHLVLLGIQVDNISVDFCINQLSIKGRFLGPSPSPSRTLKKTISKMIQFSLISFSPKVVQQESENLGVYMD